MPRLPGLRLVVHDCWITWCLPGSGSAWDSLECALSRAVAMPRSCCAAVLRSGDPLLTCWCSRDCSGVSGGLLSVLLDLMVSSVLSVLPAFVGLGLR